jgi:hypothetical protein
VRCPGALDVLSPLRGPDLASAFVERGFLELSSVVAPEYCDRLCARLERVLRGEYDTGVAPDKAPKRVKPGNDRLLGWSGNRNAPRTVQIINVWKADRTFADLVLSPTLGSIVAALGGEAFARGARVAQDQVWAKPPGAGPLVFHRDSPYFDMEPEDVVTVWITLDDLSEPASADSPSLGPLEYCVGSHRWREGRTGSANQFFQSERRRLLDSAARLEGIDDPARALEIVAVRVGRGGGSVHDGRTWHGSGPNESRDRPRRGLGIHFVPADAQWKRVEDGGRPIGRLWRRYVREGSRELPEDALPVTCDRR